MKEKAVRFFIVGILFVVGFTCIGVYFQLHNWYRWVFFAIGYIVILNPAIEYWNETLKK